MSNAGVHLVWAGRFTSREEWIHPEATLETTELIIVTEGTVSIEEGETRYALTKNSVLFLRPGIPHRGYQTSTERTSFYWMHLKHFDAVDWETKRYFTLPEPHRACMLFRQILSFMTDGFGDDVRDRLTYVLLAELSRQSAGSGREGAPAFRIREWIRINSDRALSASDVARHFSYNEDYISRLLKRYCGCSLKTLISRMRMDHVRYLLAETDLTLAEIGDRSGFADYKQFLKYFKYHEGCTPSEFRKTYCSIHTNNR